MLGQTVIPKIVHLCWLSGDPYPELIRKCIASWSTHLPDYELRHWDAESLRANSFPRWVYQAVEARKYAFAADYIRLFALYSHGGVYLDADVQVLKSFDDLLSRDAFIGREMSGDLEPAVMGSAPQLPWLKSCLEYYRDRSFIKDDGSFDMRPLPTVVGQILKDEYGADLDDQAVTRCRAARLDIFGPQYFSPKCRIAGELAISPVTYAIHHFDGQWIDNNTATRAKLALHRALMGVFGRATHGELVKFVRRLRSR